MVRSAAAVLSVLILAGFAALQQEATHTVVAGDTLWGLAQRYYQNPFQWRRIWEANQAQVTDPNLILPGWVLTIPDASAAVSDVSVETPAEPERPRTPRDERTVFYQDTSSTRAGVVRGAQQGYLSVPRDIVFSAPWLVPLEQEPSRLGTLTSFAGGANLSQTARGWDHVRLVFDGEAPAAGTRVLAFRLTKDIPDVGRVATPTGVLTLTEVEGRDAVAFVSREYDRVMLGDLLAPLPEFGLRAGQRAEEVSGGVEAMIMGAANQAELQDLDAVVFLDQGSDDGIGVGDEFEYTDALAGRDQVAGRLQVVGVSANTCAARVLQMSDVVFRQGVVVRLARKMR
jgi:LysM repeat protein